ncbi:hypothetical protein EDB82DRAFT_151039 [Fusarium venenatum]|uniref:uncharacterized protein n=1 Tax=Fusarium venenatum TaxID=56646 RepID=UPI001DC414AD|nr:hypothetical protein EDB82DRAFT_151039 [Fusarium venenatum]
MPPQDEHMPFQCRFCPKTFGRQEHLARHVRAHTREKPYGCRQCNKSFSRQDVLQRHQATHKLGVVTRNTVSARACTECAAGRSRCSRELPCGRCKERNLECIYPKSGRRKTRSMTQRNTTTSQYAGSSSSGSSNEDVEVQNHTQATEEGVEETSVLMENNVIENDVENGWITNEHQPIPMTSTGDLITTASLPESMFQINDLGDFAVDKTTAESTLAASSINWLSDSQYLSMWESQLSVVADGLGPAGYEFPSGFARPNHVSPWISAQYNDANSSDMARPVPEPAFAPSPMDVASPRHSRTDSLRGSSTSKSTDGTLYVEGTMARAPFGGQLLGRHTNQASTSHAETGSISGVPDSLEIDNQAGSSLYVSNELYSELLSATREYAEADSPESTVLIPPLGHIRCFVRLYYENFHVTHPFLRKSASIWKDPSNWILLLAVSVIGAKYLGGTWSSSLSRLLGVILDHRLDSMSEKSDQDSHGTWIPGSFQPRVRLDFITLQAFILSMIDRLHSGQKAVTERALGQMFLLVEQCRSMNLLSHTPPKIDNNVTSGNGSSIRKWLRAQSELRTGLMLWILDSIIAHEFDCPHLLQLHEVKATLPCQDDIWDEPTSDKINSNVCRQATVLEALHLLYMEKRQPSNLTEFGNIVMIYAVCRRTREAAYQYETALSRWTPVAHVEPCSESSTVAESWPPSLEIITRWRNSACDCLDILHWKANGKAANAGGSEHPTILLLHLSRLYLLAPCKHLQRVATLATFYKASNGVHDITGYSEAYTHLHRWANVDQYKARLSIIHAGALMWHIRRYSGNGFIEPHAIYIATLLVWAYSVFTSRMMHQEPLQDAGVPRLRQDIASHVPQGPANAETTHPYDDRDEEEEKEEPEPAFIHLDRPCDDEMVQTYIRLGHKMKGYMQRVGDICSTDAPPKILMEGIRLLSHKGANEKAWGIEASFVKGLKSLLDVTTAL